jgi:hypothetical protein
MPDEQLPQEPVVEPQQTSLPPDDDLDASLRDSFKNAGVEPDQSPEPVEKPKEEKPKDEKGRFVSKEKETSEKPPVEVDPKKAVAKPAAPPTSAIDPEKVKPPAKLSKEGMEGWNALKETAKRNHSLVAEKEAEIQKLQNVIAEKTEMTKKEMEKFQTELKELRGYRASFDHQFDPDFQKQYGQPMAKLEGDMKKMLMSLGVKEEVVKTMRFQDENQMARVAASIEENVNSITADRFRSRVKDYIELDDKKKEFLEEFKTKHEEFKAQKAKEFEQRNIEQSSVQLQHVNQLAQAKTETGEYRLPFLLKYTPNPDATPEQIKAIEEHNAQADEYRSKLDGIIRETDPKQRAEIAVAAVAASFLNAKLQNAQKQVRDMQAQLEKYNKVSTERTSREVSAPRKASNFDMNGEEALDAAFPNMR